MIAPPVWHEFANAQALADAIAGTVAAGLVTAVEQRGAGLLAVSGGNTPGPFFDTLSSMEIEWDRVIVTLIDERYVPTSSERSNERLVRERLLVGRAARARFIGLNSESENVEDAARKAAEVVSRWPTPLDIAVLGMGTDGHTASFLPDAEGFETLMENPEGQDVLPVRAASVPEPRLTMSAQTIAKARRVLLHIEGAEKRTVLEDALTSAGSRLPVRRVLDMIGRPVEIFWTAGN